MNSQIFKTKCRFKEKIFVGSLGLTLSLIIYNSTYSTRNLFETVIIYSILIVLTVLLFWIAYVDFKTMEIDNWLSLSILLFLLSINLLLFFNGYKENALIISEKFSYFPYENLSLALMLGLIFLIIVLITKEKALGGGDIRLAIITGLLIGNSNSLPWLYITVFSAITYGLVIGYKKGSLKNLKIPFTPFMILGATVSLLIDMFF